MLTSDEEKYLLKIPEDKIAHIYPYDSKVKTVVAFLKSKLKAAGIENDFLWIGASALGIAGQNDIDFHILSRSDEWQSLAQKVSSVFGERVKGISIFKWDLKIDGFEVELYLSDPESRGMSVQIEVYNILKNNRKLLEGYEKLKIESDGILFREYMRKKYEFFHRILKR